MDVADPPVLLEAGLQPGCVVEVPAAQLWAERRQPASEEGARLPLP